MKRYDLEAEQAAYDELTDAGYRLIEARCDRCGETFNPGGRDDLTHIDPDAGADCGPGRVLGGYAAPPPQSGRLWHR